MGQDAAKTSLRVVVGQRVDNILPDETDAPDLQHRSRIHRGCDINISNMENNVHKFASANEDVAKQTNAKVWQSPKKSKRS